MTDCVFNLKGAITHASALFSRCVEKFSIFQNLKKIAFLPCAAPPQIQNRNLHHLLLPCPPKRHFFNNHLGNSNEPQKKSISIASNNKLRIMKFLLLTSFTAIAWIYQLSAQVFTYDADGILQTADFGGTSRIAYHFDSSGNLLAVRGPTGLELWRYENFGTLDPDGQAADNASPANDGIPNIVKYAQGISPDTPAQFSNSSEFRMTPSGLEFQYWARTNDQRLSVNVQRSMDLKTWTAEEGLIQEVVREENRSLFKLIQNTGQSQKQFLRLKINYTPQ